MSIESVMPSNHLVLCHPLLLLPSTFPASGSFPVSQLFESGGQRIGASASESVLLMNIRELTGWISLQSKGLSRVFSNTTVQKHKFFSTHTYMTIGKIIALTRWTFGSKVMSLLFNMKSWNSNTLATWCKELTHWKRSWCWESWRQEEKGTTEDKVVGWHHWLNGHEFEQAPGAGEGQGSLVCYSPWGHKKSDMLRDWTELNWFPSFSYFPFSLINRIIIYLLWNS